MSFKPEVIANRSGKWTGSPVRFETEAEAEEYLIDLALRWTSVREARAVESGDPVNSRWVDGRLVIVKNMSSNAHVVP